MLTIRTFTCIYYISHLFVGFALLIALSYCIKLNYFLLCPMNIICAVSQARLANQTLSEQVVIVLHRVANVELRQKVFRMS